MRHLSIALIFSAALAACGSNHSGDDSVGDDAGGGDDDGGGPCQNLECFQVTCTGGGTTSVSGTVYAPNGTLPLYNVTVYVPNGTVQAFDEGAQCDRCGSVLSGNPLVQTATDTEGHFTLTNMPATGNVPLVIQVGKWRRQITIPAVPECVDTPLAGAETRLPRTQAEGDIPLMALTTGGADALECLLRKVGIADSEFSTAGGSGRVHLYYGNQTSAGGGTNKFDSSTGGGGDFANAQTLWNTTNNLLAYDVVFLSCEGDQNPADKSQGARMALKSYADAGGRVFASHWHNYWLQEGPAPWDDLVSFPDPWFEDYPDQVTGTINTNFDRGQALAAWAFGAEVMASTVFGEIAIQGAKHTVIGVDETEADRWISSYDNTNDAQSIQYLSFTTPLEDPADERCGRVVFSDIHVSSGVGDTSQADLAFPSGGCTTDVDDMSPQEKILAFMIFDIASCVGPVVD